MLRLARGDAGFAAPYRSGWTKRLDLRHPVHRHVGKFVCPGVPLPIYVRNRDLADVIDETDRLTVERLQVRRLHFVDAVDLAHDEFRIRSNNEFFGFKNFGCGKAAKEGGVFGKVAGAVTEEFPKLIERLFFFVEEDNPNTGRAGIATLAAVEVQNKRAPFRCAAPGGGGRLIRGKQAHERSLPHHFRQIENAAARVAAPDGIAPTQGIEMLHIQSHVAGTTGN